MKIYYEPPFTHEDWSRVKLWFSRAFPRAFGIRVNSDTVNFQHLSKYYQWIDAVGATTTGTLDGITSDDIDTLGKIEAFYQADQAGDPDNNTTFQH